MVEMYRYVRANDRLRRFNFGTRWDWLTTERMAELIAQDWPVCTDLVVILVSKGAELPHPRYVVRASVRQTNMTPDAVLAKKNIERVLDMPSAPDANERVVAAVRKFAQEYVRDVGTLVISEDPEDPRPAIPAPPPKRSRSSSVEEEDGGYVRLFYDTLFNNEDYMPVYRRIRSGDPVPEWILVSTIRLYFRFNTLVLKGKRYQNMMKPRVGALVFAMCLTGNHVMPRNAGVQFLRNRVAIQKFVPPEDQDEFDAWFETTHDMYQEEVMRIVNLLEEEEEE